MIGIYHDETILYPDEAPFHPSEQYSEFAYRGPSYRLSRRNMVFSAVRNLFNLVQLDREHFGTEQWNPLGELIEPGYTVVLKPNLVLHEIGDLVGKHCLYTDGSVIRAVLDYTLKAAGPNGRVIIADAPLQGADFSLLCKQSGLEQIRGYYQEAFGISIEVIDLRREWARLSDDGTQILNRQRLEGDPKGYSIIDLGVNSALEPICADGVKFSITDYRDKITQVHHQPGKHEYMISNSILNADCVISIPKLKSHQKAGLTAALKNFIGINGAKDFLAHHRKGSPNRGGDEYPENSLFSFLFSRTRALLNEHAPQLVWRVARQNGLRVRRFLADHRVKKGKSDINSFLIGAGGWYGNDTIWRMIHDINKIFFLYDLGGQQLLQDVRRKYLCVVDAIVAGEGNGPISPTPKYCGCLLSGVDPVKIDVVCAKLMGFDWKKIPFLREFRELGQMTSFNGGICDEDWVTNSDHIKGTITTPQSHGFGFLPSDGWLNHIENTRRVTAEEID